LIERHAGGALLIGSCCKDVPSIGNAHPPPVVVRQ